MTDIAKVTTEASAEIWTASDGASGDQFGLGIAVDGDLAVVGAPYDDDLGASTGAAYVMERSGGVWSETQKLVGLAAGDLFGWNVSCSEGGEEPTIVVSAINATVSGTASVGAVHVFTKVGGTWTLQQTCEGSTSSRGNGAGLFLDGDCFVMGSKWNNNRYAAGWRRSGGVWTEHALPLTGTSATDYYGVSVHYDASSDRCVVSEYKDDDVANDSGAAHVYEWDGSAWVHMAKLKASDASSNQWLCGISTTPDFTHGCAIRGDYCFLGCASSSSYSGALYVFKYSGTWAQVRKHSFSLSRANWWAGLEVSLHGDFVLCGAPQGVPNDYSSGAIFVVGTVNGWENDSYDVAQLFEASLPNTDLGYRVASDGATILSSRGPFSGNGTVLAITGVELGSASGDAAPPTITIVSPSVGSDVDPFDAITIDLTDDTALRRVVLMARYPYSDPDRITETIWNGALNEGAGAFLFPFKDSTRTVIADGYRFTIKRTNGWQSAPTIDVVAIDTAGNEA